MKRTGNLYPLICSMDNLRLADKIACQGKAKQYGVILHNRNKEANLQALHQMLVTKTYKTSPYSTFSVFEPKERLVYRLPYWPDRITHHAVMNILEPLFVAAFTADTYSCIKGRGIHAASYALRNDLKRDKPNTAYFLQMDIRKFYPTVDHAILKLLLRRKFKDPELLWLLDEIIDSAEGLPIGNYLSQYFANFYLTGFDHWLKETVGVKYYYRYADDLVFLAGDKAYLHELALQVSKYCQTELKLTVKPDYTVAPVAAQGIDFVGYVHYHTHVRLRKSIKKRFARVMVRHKNRASLASYHGWAKHCNSINLIKKLTNESLSRIGYQVKKPDRK